MKSIEAGLIRGTNLVAEELHDTDNVTSQGDRKREARVEVFRRDAGPRETGLSRHVRHPERLRAVPHPAGYANPPWACRLPAALLEASDVDGGRVPHIGDAQHIRL